MTPTPMLWLVYCPNGIAHREWLGTDAQAIDMVRDLDGLLSDCGASGHQAFRYELAADQGAVRRTQDGDPEAAK